MSAAQWFNVGAFFVLFREALEATIIIGLLLRYIQGTVKEQVAQQKLRKQIYLGTIFGLGLSTAIGVAFTIVFYVLKTDVFGKAEPIFEGTLQLLACLLLTWLAFRMMEISTLFKKWEQKIQTATNNQQSSRYGFILLAFTIVIREGIESVVFIAGVGQGEPTSLIIPGLLGISTGIGVGYVLYKGSTKLNLRSFFIVSTVFLLVIAAGLITNASHEFEEYYFDNVVNYDVEGSAMFEDQTDQDNGIGEEVGGPEGIPDSTRVLWNLQDCCDEENFAFFQVINVFTGWRAKPTVVTTVTYFLYWILVWSAFGIRYFVVKRKESLTADDEKGSRLLS